MTRPSPVVQVMIDAALRAGRGLLRDFARFETVEVSQKGVGDVVSAADLQAEETIYTFLSRVRPGYGFLMEERGAVVGTDHTNRFIVDPLDGTQNFLHGLAHFAVSIGLERAGELAAGVIYDVTRNDMYWSETGRGAWLDQRKQRVGRRRAMGLALLGTGAPKNSRRPADEASLATAAGVRRSGSAALDLAYVAAGRLDGYWSRGLKPWDIAAGAVLVREAGGHMTGIDGSDFMDNGDLVAANRVLRAKIHDLLTGAVKSD